MNKQRRKRIAELVEKIGTIASDLEPLVNEAEALADEERDAYESMPDSIQQGDRGQEASSAVDSLDEAKSQLDSAKEAADEAVNQLESIQ